MRLIQILIVISLLPILGCSSGGENSKNDPNTNSDVYDPLSGIPISDYEILFIGNSHSKFNDLPGLVRTLIHNDTAEKQANTANAEGWLFLDERLNDGITNATINSRPWTHVILQAQKYSSTGLYFYSTDAAEEWIRRIKANNALPVLFPEWPRRGNTEEGLRVHELHVEISGRESACVAPIGLAWDEAISSYPSLSLHAQDGNHSNLTGALLTAYVLYEVITGQQATNLPYLNQINVPSVVQQQLRDLATSIVGNSLYCGE